MFAIITITNTVIVVDTDESSPKKNKKKEKEQNPEFCGHFGRENILHYNLLLDIHEAH